MGDRWGFLGLQKLQNLHRATNTTTYVKKNQLYQIGAPKMADLPKIRGPLPPKKRYNPNIICVFLETTWQDKQHGIYLNSSSFTVENLVFQAFFGPL